MAHHDVAVVGAGVTGLLVARALHAAGRSVVVLDKGRRPGGRLSSRRLDDAVLDPGAVWLDLDDPEVRDHLTRTAAPASLRAVGGSQHRFVLDEPEAFIGALSGGLEVVHTLVTHLDLASTSRIDAVPHVAGHPFGCDQVVLTMPVPQARTVLAASGVPTVRPLDGVDYHRAIVLLARLAAPIDLGADEVEVQAPATGPTPAPILRIRDEYGRGRSAVPAVTVTATPAWSSANWELDVTVLQASLLRALCAAVPRAVITDATLKRWRYATPIAPLPDRTFLQVPGHRIFVAGDGFGSPPTAAGSVGRAVRSALDVLAAL